MTEHHIPFLSEDEQLFLNTTASYSQARRMSNLENSRQSVDDSNYGIRRHHGTSGHTLSFFWKRRDSSSSSFTQFSAGSVDCTMQTEYFPRTSPKAKELETLIFAQPQRTVRLSLTPRCAV
ncbi:unnamed protein product [Rhizopus stolonifer]